MDSSNRVSVLCAAVLALGSIARAQIVPPSTRLVSVNSTASGTGNGDSTYIDISDDGRFVVFQSRASDLVPSDGNGLADIFLRDMQGGSTTLISVAMAGTSGNAASDDPAISADGRFVAFASNASNLVPGDTFNSYDVFVRDLTLGTTALVSIGIAGAKPNDFCAFPRISGDGRVITFHSRASNLVPGDTNSSFDVFAHDRLSGTTVRVNVSAAGTQSPASPPPSQGDSSISDNGRFVAFESGDSNLVPGDTNPATDIFLKDLQTGAIEIVSLAYNGQQANDFSYSPVLSDDAR